MLLGVPYNELMARHYPLRRAEEMEIGLGLDDACEIAKEEGHELFVIHSYSQSLGPSIVIVPSINQPGSTHAVIWTGSYIKDPSTKQKITEIGPVQKTIVSVKDEIALALARHEAKRLLKHIL